MAKGKPRTQPRGAPRANTSEARRLKFDYLKSTAFRVIHVDGAWGGLRPDFTFHLSLYSERNAIPKSLTIDLDPDNLSAERVVTTEGRDAIIREVEVCAIFDMGTARSLRDWLSDMLQKGEERLAELAETEKKESD